MKNYKTLEIHQLTVWPVTLFPDHQLSHFLKCISVRQYKYITCSHGVCIASKELSQKKPEEVKCPPKVE